MPAKKRQVQDDLREEILTRSLKLTRTGKRIGPDAKDEHGNLYELKTTTKQGLSTARDIGPEYLARMRIQYLIAARGRNTDYGFSIEDIYFLHPDDLDNWIKPIEDRLQADMDIVNQAHSALSALGAGVDTLKRILAIGKRGITLNNPKIPWQYVTDHGTRLGENPSLDLRELVAARPLPTSTSDP